MSQSPFLLPRTPPKYGGQFMNDSIVFDGLTCGVEGIHMVYKYFKNNFNKIGIMY